MKAEYNYYLTCNVEISTDDPQEFLSICTVDIDSRMFDRIVSEVENTDVTL